MLVRMCVEQLASPSEKDLANVAKNQRLLNTTSSRQGTESFNFCLVSLLLPHSSTVSPYVALHSMFNIYLNSGACLVLLFNNQR